MKLNLSTHKAHGKNQIFTDAVMRKILDLIKNGAKFVDLERETKIPMKKIKVKLLLLGYSIKGLDYPKSAPKNRSIKAW